MKLVVSVMPKSLEEAQEIDVSRYEDADIIEWRADFLAKDDILNVAPAIFEKFAGRELIFTLRTRQEGGEIELSDDEYVALNCGHRVILPALYRKLLLMEWLE